VWFLGIEYAALRGQVLKGGTDEEVLAWCFANGNRPNEEQVLIWNTFVLKRGWRDEDDGSTQELERYRVASGWGTERTSPPSSITTRSTKAASPEDCRPRDAYLVAKRLDRKICQV
jgi:uncharacterized protein DUF5069